MSIESYESYVKTFDIFYFKLHRLSASYIVSLAQRHKVHKGV